MTAVDAAWQAALAAEHRAVFGYGLLGAQLHHSPRLALAIRCSDAHEALRDTTESAMVAARLTPVPPAADYPDLYPVTTAAQAAALAVRLEDGCAAAWRFLYAATAAPGGRSPAVRAAAQTALTASAVRAVQWRQAPVPFPGL
jgi:hypothetical protein